MDTDRTDEELVVRFVDRGDGLAFDELVRRYRETVFRLAVSVLGPKFVAEAEEVAQEVFLRVHYSLASFRRDAKFSSWIYRITFNQALNVKARMRYRVPHMQYEALAETTSAPSDPIEDLSTDLVLSDCMVRLPEVYQSALRLYYWMDYGVSEISGLLGLPEGTVKSYLHRARQLLKAMLEEKGYADA